MKRFSCHLCPPDIFETVQDDICYIVYLTESDLNEGSFMDFGINLIIFNLHVPIF